jgi:Clp protease
MRASLPSATMMLRQPIQRFEQMQASDIDIYRNELRCARRCARCSPLRLRLNALASLCGVLNGVARPTLMQVA